MTDYRPALTQAYNTLLKGKGFKPVTIYAGQEVWDSFKAHTPTITRFVDKLDEAQPYTEPGLKFKTATMHLDPSLPPDVFRMVLDGKT